MFDIETGHEVWSVDTDGIHDVIVTSNGSIYGLSAQQKQLVKIDPETGDITELYPIDDHLYHIVQYRSFLSIFCI